MQMLIAYNTRKLGLTSAYEFLLIEAKLGCEIKLKLEFYISYSVLKIQLFLKL